MASAGGGGLGVTGPLLWSLFQKESAKASFLPTPRQGLVPPSFPAERPPGAQSRERKVGELSESSVDHPHHATAPSRGNSRGPHVQQCSSLTRLVFFSSAFLADMMEEARVFFNFPTSPQWAPVTRPLSYADYRPRQGQDDHLFVCGTAEVTMPSCPCWWAVSPHLRADDEGQRRF